MATYFITGATGHLGYHLTRALEKNDHVIYALVLPKDPLRHTLPTSVRIIEGNILNEASIAAFLSQPGASPRILIHAASHVTTELKRNPLTYEVNVTGTRLLLNHLPLGHIDHMIYVSSVHALKTLPKHQEVNESHLAFPKQVFGFYAKTKAEATQILWQAVQEDGAPISIVFPSGFIGPNDLGDGYTTLMIKEAMYQRVNIWFRGGYDFVDVRDVAKGIIAVAERKKIGKLYILNHTFIPFKILMRAIDRASQHRPYRVYIPKFLIWLAIPFVGMYDRCQKKKPLLNRCAFMTMSTHTRFSHQKATQELDFHPRDLNETILDTISEINDRNKY